jgi:hypothetical protein
MLSIVAAACAGLFAGAALFVSAVEHPARISRGAEFAVEEFASSYPRAAVMQSILAVTGTVTGLWSAWPTMDARKGDVAELLGRWGRLHAVRSLVSTLAFVIFLTRS